LAIACIGAAAGGGYLASRQNTVPTPASAQVQSTPAAPAPPAAVTPSAPASQPVQETETVVGEASPKNAAPKNAAAKRVEPPPRAATSRDARAASPRQEAKATPPLTSTWPTSAASPQPPVTPPATQPVVDPPPAPRVDEHPAVEPARAPEPPQHTIEELVVSAQTVIGLETETRLSSETARLEDRVDARVTRDVKAGDRVAIPAGSRAIGSVMQVERGGKFKERARLGIRFHTLVLADGTRVPISTETIFRDGEAPGNSSAAKVGGAAVGGAILGAILGGAKGAAIGAAAGGIGGLIYDMATRDGSKK